MCGFKAEVSGSQTVFPTEDLHQKRQGWDEIFGFNINAHNDNLCSETILGIIWGWAPLFLEFWGRPPILKKQTWLQDPTGFRRGRPISQDYPFQVHKQCSQPMIFIKSGKDGMKYSVSV